MRRSGYNIGQKGVFYLVYAVFQGQFLFFQPLNLDHILFSHLDHGINRLVEVAVTGPQFLKTLFQFFVVFVFQGFLPITVFADHFGAMRAILADCGQILTACLPGFKKKLHRSSFLADSKRGGVIK
jgi:hypothetical protein